MSEPLYDPVPEDEVGQPLKYPWASFLQSLFVSYVSNYKTPKLVIIRSPKLQIPYIVMNMLLFVLVMCKAFVWEAKFLDVVEIHGLGRFYALPPVSNWWTCSNNDIDCKQKFPDLQNPPYCKRLSVGSYVFRDKLDPKPYCSIGNRLTDTFESSSGRLFVSTAITETVQHGHLDYLNAGGVVWDEPQNQSTKLRYVAGIENWLVMLKWAFPSAACRDSACNMYDAQGILRIKMNDKDRLELIQSVSYNKSTKKVDNFFKDCCAPWRRSKEIKACEGHGYSDGLENEGDTDESRHSCFQSDFGDSISIARLLEAANVSLDMPSTWTYEGGDIPVRFSGLMLQVDIKYENHDAIDFWKWKFGTKPKYTYSVSRVMLPALLYAQPRAFEEMLSNTTRKVVKHAGIDIKFVVHGTHGCYSLLGVFRTLILTTTIITVSKVVINYGMVSIYWFFHPTVSRMFEWYKYQESAAEEEVRQHVKFDQGNFSELDAKVHTRRSDRFSRPRQSRQQKSATE